jgi:hypothetical protein
MTNEDKDKDKDIELRSEKVRNITGKIPPVLVRYGITVIAITLLALFVISLIIPYRETIDLSITIHSNPNAAIIRANNSGKIIIDTNTVVMKNTIIAYIQSDDKIYPVYAYKTGNIVFSVKNGQFVEKDDIVLIIITADSYKIYGIADIDKDNAKKITTGMEVCININEQNRRGAISNIYASDIEQAQYKIEIEIDTVDNIYPNSKYQGIIIVSEKSFFKKIFL